MTSSSEKPIKPTPLDELAALYALDMLDRDDSLQLHQALAEDEPLVEQVTEFQAAAAAIPYGTPAIPMADDLKARLFQRIAQEPEAPDSPLMVLLKRSIDELKQQATELAWEPLGSSLAEIAVWQTDEEHREVAFFVRQAKGGLFPNHAHATGEAVLVLEGDFAANGHVYEAGELVHSVANTAHQPITQTGCLLLCVSSMDDELLTEQPS